MNLRNRNYQTFFMKIGYARVSTNEQNLNLQIDDLKKAGCRKIYKETATGAKAERRELNNLLGNVRKGDVIVIWKLDRLGRSLKHLVELVNQLIEKKVGLLSLNDPINTTTPQGRLIFNIFASLAEFERDIIRERTHAGLSAARARGRKGGRPKGLSEQAHTTACAAETLYADGKMSVNDICKKLGIAKATFYSYLRHRGVEVSPYTKKARSK